MFIRNFVEINKKYKIGFRAIKTAIAVSICAFVSMFYNHEDIFCACIASVICMEQTYKKTLDTGINRFIGTLIGGTIGYFALELCYFSSHYRWMRVLLLPVCILLVVYICNFINRKEAVSIGCVVVIVVLSRSSQIFSNTLNYVLQRVCDTLIGVFVAMVVNKIDFKKERTQRKKEHFCLVWVAFCFPRFRQ